jgi:hypothetical protein
MFAIPGNHDVDWDEVLASREDIYRKYPHLLRPDQSGAEARRRILPRFAGFCSIASLFAGEPVDWLQSEQAAFTEVINLPAGRIGIAGINTAWLSDDRRRDKGHLSPGTDLLEQALEKIEQCDLKVVLGHHPLDWLEGADGRNERAVIARLLSASHALYLHGHLHKADVQRQVFRTEGFLTVQAAAGFQAHDDEVWVNGLLWGEADLADGFLRLQAREWNKVNEWVFASHRFNPGDADPKQPNWFRYPLPSADVSAQRARIEKSAIIEARDLLQPEEREEVVTPKGWTWVTPEWLAAQREEPADTRLLRFFDGLLPTWQLALSSRVPRRKVVDTAIDELLEALGTPGKPRVLFFEGPGGEGKSTAFFQTMAGLSETDPRWRILWRDNDMQGLPPDYAHQIADDGRPLLVATDEADNSSRRSCVRLKGA